MKITVKNPLTFAIACLLLGIITAISFIETPLKFQVEGMTLPIALGLGKLMFGISTNIQLGAILLIFLVLLTQKNTPDKTWIFVSTVSIIFLLAMEKFWMLPILDARADVLMQGKGLPPTPLHDYFIYAEVIKFVLILVLAIQQLKIPRIELRVPNYS